MQDAAFKDLQIQQKVIIELIENVWSSGSKKSNEPRRRFLNNFECPIFNLEDLQSMLEDSNKYSQIDYLKFKSVYDLICHKRKLPLLKGLKGISIFMM